VHNAKDILNVFYHGALEQPERDVALCKFRNGTSNVLVTTDLASRGLDIANIRYIIHYHLPGSEDIFTHRNGRTARMDASGTAILILSPEEKLPSLGNSILSSLLPVILLGITTVMVPYITQEGLLRKILLFVGDPAIVKAGNRVVITGHLAIGVMSYCMQGQPFQIVESRLG